MKRLLLTGGSGFIGHHLIEGLLKDTDWEIVCLDRLDTSTTLKRIHDISVYEKEKNRIKFVWWDLKSELNDFIKQDIGNVDYIWHIAASSHVDRSIENPLSFVMDNVVGTCNLLNYARSLKNLKLFIYFSTDEVFGPAPEGVFYKEWDRYNSGNPYAATKAGAEELCLAFQNTYKMPIIITHCHDENTKCWTENGFKSYNELKIGDLIWVLKNNNEMCLEPIKEIVVSDYDGKMISFNNKKYDLLVTPNHRMLTKRRYGEDCFTIKEASTIQKEISGTSIRHYIPTNGKWIGETSKTPNEMAFVGWFVSEGSSNKRGTISIATTKYYEEICNIIKTLGFKPKICGKNIQFYSKQFEDSFITRFGRGASNKEIPKEYLSQSIDLLEVLFDSLMKGDGSITSSYKRYYTKSYKLAEQVAELAIKLGYTASIKSRFTFTPKKDKFGKSYYVCISNGKGVSIESRNIKELNYKGKIWCVRTNSGNFFVSRNGNICCSGNTMNVFGERQHPEKFIPMTIKKVLNGDIVTIHADKTATKAGIRSYIHARNVLKALLFLTDCVKIYGDKFNIVGEKEVDNLSLALYIADVLGKDLKYKMVDFHSTRPGHDLRYALNGDKLKEMGFKFPLTFDKSLDKTIKWYLNNKEWLLGDSL